MANAKMTASAKLITLLVLIPIALVVWVALPYFLPIWRWQHMEGKPWVSYPEHTWAALAKKSNIPEDKLRTVFTWVIRYAPRNGGPSKDPYPWQIVSSSPAWIDHMPDTDDDETNTLVRIVALNDRDGLPRSRFGLGTGNDEVFFKIQGWRFPPGTFGQSSKHPVILYQGQTFEDHLPIGEGQVLNTQVANMESDDNWESRADGFGKPVE